jgi:hypothetical protein
MGYLDGCAAIVASFRNLWIENSSVSVSENHVVRGVAKHYPCNRSLWHVRPDKQLRSRISKSTT